MQHLYFIMIRYNFLLFVRSSGKSHLQNGIFLLCIFLIFCIMAYIDQSVYEMLLFQMPGIVFFADYASIKINRFCDVSFFSTISLSMIKKFMLLIIQKLSSNILIPLLMYLTIYIVHFNFSSLHIMNVVLVYLASLLISIATMHHAYRIHSSDKFICCLGSICFFLPIVLFNLFQIFGASRAEIIFLLSVCSNYEKYIFFVSLSFLFMSGVLSYLLWRYIVGNTPWCSREMRTLTS